VEAAEIAAVDGQAVTVRCVGLCACCQARQQAGDLQGAREKLDEAVWLADSSLAGPHQQAEGLTAVGAAATALGDTELSRASFERALGLALQESSVVLGGGGTPDRFGRTTALIQTTPPSIEILSVLAETEAQCGQQDLAEATLDQTAVAAARDEESSPRLARAIWAVRGPIAGAAAFADVEAAASVMPEPGAAIEAYCEIADELRQVADGTPVSDVLARAEAIAGTAADGVVRAAALAKIAAATRQSLGEQAAHPLFQSAEAVASSARTSFERVRAWIAVADAHTRGCPHLYFHGQDSRSSRARFAGRV
jgi:hypothetical protein